MTDILPVPFKYQEYERDKIIRLKRTAVIAPPGSGKTRPIVEGFVALGVFDGLCLIVCSGPAVATWKRQIPLWSQAPEYAEHIVEITGTPKQRQKLWKQAADTRYGTYIINFSIFRNDFNILAQIPWTGICADEYHKAMRRHKTKFFRCWMKLTRHMEIMVITTGSVVRKEASSMFTAFHAIDPALKLFRSYWRFVGAFCWIDDTGKGKHVFGVRNGPALRKLMDHYMAYVPEEVVADELPEGLRSRYAVTMEPSQAKVYAEIAEHMLSIMPSGDIVASPTVLSKLIMLRQLLCCPKIIDESLGYGGGFEAIVDTLDAEPHVVIFVPFRPACDYIVQGLNERGYMDTFILRGGVKEKEQTEIIEAFSKSGGQLVCTIDYAESFDLLTPKLSWFLGYHDTVDQNEQAEGRTRRANSTHEFVRWQYLVHQGTHDEVMMARLGTDAKNIRQILERSDEFIAALKGK